MSSSETHIYIYIYHTSLPQTKKCQTVHSPQRINIKASTYIIDTNFFTIHYNKTLMHMKSQQKLQHRIYSKFKHKRVNKIQRNYNKTVLIKNENRNN